MTVTATCALITAGVGFAGIAQSYPAAPTNTRQTVSTTPLTSSTSSTLSSALASVAWVPARDGVLLVVDPESKKAVSRDPETVPPLPSLSSSDSGSEITGIATRFDLKVITLSGVTILAPAKMTVVPDRLPRPNIYAGIDRSRRLVLFLASLNSGQWQRLASSEGISLGDLGYAQSDLFSSFVPNPFRVRRKGKPGSPQESTITLTEQQRRAVRLRLNLEAYSGISLANAGNKEAGVPLRAPSNAGFSRLGHVDGMVLAEKEDPSVPFGPKFTSTVDNALKPRHLDIDAPSFTTNKVPLTGVKTVGDIVKRISLASHVELYAAPELARLPVWIRYGRTVSAAALLKALCYGVTGTFRRVGPESGARAAFVLTDDVQGVGQRQARAAEWLRDTMLRAETISGDSIENPLQKIVEAQPLSYLQFAPDDPFALPGNAITQWANSAATREDGTAVIPTEAFADIARELIQKRATELAERGQAIAPEHSRIAMKLAMYYLVPGMGEAFDYSQEPISATFLVKAPPKHPPLVMLPESSGEPPLGDAEPYATCPIRALCVSPQNAQDVQTVVTAAIQHKLNEVWVALPDEGGFGLLTDAIRICQDNHIAIRAVLRLLSRSVPREPNTPNDIYKSIVGFNILGETNGQHAFRRAPLWRSSGMQQRLLGKAAYSEARDWLNPGNPMTEKLVLERIMKVARVPGLNGLVFIDTAVPGYGFRWMESYSFSDALDLGYDPETRLAFLRTGGGDPIDTFDPSGMAPLRLPPFTFDGSVKGAGEGPGGRSADEKPTWQLWGEFRRKQNASFLSRIYDALHTSMPMLDIMARPAGDYGAQAVTWFASWDNREAFPGHEPWSGSQDLSSFVHTQSRRNVIGLSWQYRLPDTAPKNAAGYAAQIRTAWNSNNKDKGKWEGVVLDLSSIPIPRAIELMGYRH